MALTRRIVYDPDLEAFCDMSKPDPEHSDLGQEMTTDEVCDLIDAQAKELQAQAEDVKRLQTSADAYFDQAGGWRLKAGDYHVRLQAALAGSPMLFRGCSVRGDTTHARYDGASVAVCGEENVYTVDESFNHESAYACKKCLKAIDAARDRGQKG